MRNNVIAERRGRFFADPGNPIHDIFSAQLQSDGTLKLIKIGEENTDEVIQSFYESTTLECILAKYANGDLSALNRYQPIYADLTYAPKNLAEALQVVINSRDAFDHLPIEIKKQFGNDFNVWLAQSGSPEWMKAMTPISNLKDQTNSQNLPDAPTAEKSTPISADA